MGAVNDLLIKRAYAILSNVDYLQYTFHVSEGHGGVYLQATYVEPDVRTGEQDIQYTRKWLLSPHMTDSEIVQTAFKCALTSAEHRVREWFKYKDHAIFGPHYDIEDLVQLQQRGGRS